MSDVKAIIPAKAGYGYIAGLDGLRALSVIIVVIAHMGLVSIVPGGFGVTVFFFISGFLITRLLLAESEGKGNIALGKFYMRRIVRLYPALLFMLFLTACFYVIFSFGKPAPMEIASSIGYFNNIFQVVSRVNGEQYIMPWWHLWSLAVEEHFYLGFPVLIVLCRKNWRVLALVLGGVIITALLWRIYIAFGTNLPADYYNYMMTDARIDSLAWGCLLSVVLHMDGGAQNLRKLIGFLPTLVGFAALVASFLFRDESFRTTLRFSIHGAALFLLILNLYYWQGLEFAISILEWKPLAYIGMVSYPLYLWHLPVIDVMERGFGDSFSVMVSAVFISFGLAAFSFNYVEKPFIKLRKKFGSHLQGQTLHNKNSTLSEALRA